MTIIIGAVIGAVLRFAIYELCSNKSHSSIPTLIVNVTGSLLLGLYVQYLPEFQNSFFVIGLLSSFTTFSTFSVDSLKWIMNGQWLQAILYVVANVSLCCLAIIVGLHI